MSIKTQLRTSQTKMRLGLRQMRYRLQQRNFSSKHWYAQPGTPEWLILSEIKYGGFHTNVPKKVASPKDPAKTGFFTGGDRMLSHGYAEKYSEYLMPYVQNDRPVTLIEVGILKGTGLAIWCDLFKEGTIIGLDIDLQNMHANRPNLEGLGAFQNNRPQLFEFDQFSDNRQRLSDILNGSKIDIFIDDGCHTNDAIMGTLQSAIPHLSDTFTYFVEDNREVHHLIRASYPELKIESCGDLSVVSKA